MNQSPYTPLSANQISSAIQADTASKIQDILILPEISSTNDALWERFSKGQQTPAVCLAEKQTAGRGRRGDTWHSPPAGNLYLSIYWPHAAQKLQHGLSLAIGISLINTLKSFNINNLNLKWPNDVLFNRHKLAGILVESRISNTQQHSVIGIGLNFKLPTSTQEQIQQPTTSLEQLCDNIPDRNRLAGKIIQNMIETIQRFDTSGLTDFLPVWPQYDALHNQDIYLINENEKIEAKACGINDKGELRYQHNNQIHTLSNSHISIRFAS